jgi:hypothetical protein
MGLYRRKGYGLFLPIGRARRLPHAIPITGFSP